MSARQAELKSGRCRRWLGATLVAGLLPGWLAPATAQEVDRGTSVLNLPRPGYEPRTFRFEGVTVAPQIVAEGHYDSNVFAVSDRDLVAAPQSADDFVFNIAPRVDIDASRDNLQLAGDVSANFRGHAKNGNEDSFTFGAGGSADYAIGATDHVSGGLRYARAVESRADPESTAQTNQSPSKLDTFSADVGYRYRRSRLGVAATASLQTINYLPGFEDDRDQTSYRGGVRASLRLSPRFDLFVDGYGNRRDARLAVDRGGVDRDVTTFGALTGVSVEIGNRWRGAVGVGAFRANPDDPSLGSFSGFAANGNITWSPDERTAVTANVFSGDVATIRAGASGRIDTRIGLRIDQEARHNLLWNLSGGYRETYYRGGLDRRQRTATVAFGTEYLVNGQWSVLGTASFARRMSQVTLDEFERGTVGIGLRLRY